MRKNFNFNYAFVFYDVNEKRVNKVFKVCKKYFHHHQNSVFRGAITPANLIKLKNEINKIIEGTDFVTIIKLINGDCFDEETLGINEKNTEDLIL
ncbi:CRISPR-associated endonuclease Cas2 [Clostridium neuense]|uniref:CRISPR-associated endoribonuclease Cas2 n=1 Tax=Clostridium neuense TaxID=1728934 RepID=A0ABW8TP79_9CLOT